MNEMQVNFRSSMHGFNREDVVSYIEQNALEHEKELRGLQDENARLQQLLDENNAEELRAELETERQQTDELSKRCSTLYNENRALQDELDALKAELAQLQDELAQAKAVPETVPEAPEDVSPLDAPIAPVKETRDDSIAALELAAYRRAEVAERLARERAAKVYEQLGSVFTDADNRLLCNSNDLDRLSDSLRLNMTQLQEVLCAIRSSYDNTREAFRSFSEENAELTDY